MTDQAFRVAIRVDGGDQLARAELAIRQEMIDVSTGSTTKPDPSWVLVDGAGHYHRWAEDGQLPTLERTTRHVDCSGGCSEDDCQGYDVDEYRCAICRVEIQPGVITTGPTSAYMPGMKTWEVDVDQVLDVEQGQRVSVVTEVIPGFDDQPGAVLFGVAMVARVEVTGGRYDLQQGAEDHMTGRTHLVGVGALGRATASAAT